jgi:hypothetical protein
MGFSLSAGDIDIFDLAEIRATGSPSRMFSTAFSFSKRSPYFPSVT